MIRKRGGRGPRDGFWAGEPHRHVGRASARTSSTKKTRGYGERIVAALGRQLEQEFGRGFGSKNLHRMIQFAEVFPDEAIVASLRESGGTHFKAIIPIADPLPLDFMPRCAASKIGIHAHWQRRLAGCWYGANGAVKEAGQTNSSGVGGFGAEDRLTPDLVIFRDPYMLDFLQLHDTYAEQDFNTAILREIESFILELGPLDFASWPGRNEWQSTMKTIISICCSIIANSGDWSRLIQAPEF